MGARHTVQASAPPPPPPPPNAPPPLQGSLAPSSPSAVEIPPPTDAKLENPGSFEDLHKKCKEIFPVNFEGARLMFNNGLSNHFQISHTINMSSVTPPGYRIGATYVGTKQIRPTECYPVILGDADPDGNINANFIHQFTPEIKCKGVAQMQLTKLNVTQLTSEYKGDLYTATLSLGAQEPIFDGSFVAVGHYLQTVTPNLALGAELLYQRNRKILGGEIAVLSAAARYTSGDVEVSGTLGLQNLHLCYYKNASEDVQFGVELETSLRSKESVGTIGYQVQIPKADMVFKGMVDSNWNVGAVLEKRLQPLPFSFALSGMINHTQSQYKFGCGLVVG